MEFVPVFYTTSSNGEDVGSAIENVWGSAISYNSPICCETTLSPSTKPLAVARRMGVVVV